MNNEISIDIRPQTSVYGTYRRLSYKPWFAIAEFIDNSTQSYYNHRDELKADVNFSKLVINIKYDPNEGYIEITDNAYGMNFEDFQRALILDKPPINTSGRNEFGMGLKTAACWFGDLWTVETTEYNSNKKFTATMDIKKFEREKTTNINPNIEIVFPEIHMTKITIRDLNQKLTSTNIRKIKDLLQRIYRVDLRSGEIDILWNGEKLVYDEIEIFSEEMEDGTTKVWKKDIEFDVSDPIGNTYHVSGWIGIQNKGIYQKAGFSLLRRGRVIIGADENYKPVEIFGSTASTYEKMYLCGELNLDNFPITQAKDGFMWDNGLEDEFISELNRHSAEYAQKARARRNENKAKKVIEFKQEEIDDIVNSTVKKFNKLDDEIKTKISAINTENDNQVKEESTQYQIPSNIEEDKSKNLPEKYVFNYDKYSIEIKWDDTSEDGPWLVTTKLNNDNFGITINIRHNFFVPFINDTEFIKVINQLAIALVLAEKEAMESTTDPNQRIEHWAIRSNMNEILSILATMKE